MGERDNNPDHGANAGGSVEGGEKESNFGFTAEEQAAFNEMRQEPVDEPAPGADVPADGDAKTPPADGAVEGADGGADEDDDEPDADPAAGAAGKAAQPDANGEKPPPRRVNYARYRRDIDKREKELKEERERNRVMAENQARLDERMKLLTEALTPQKKEEMEDQDPMPDPEQDIFGYAQWQGRQIERLAAEVNNIKTGSRAQQDEAQLFDAYKNDVVNYARQDPTFSPAYQYLMASRTIELAQVFFGKDVTEEGATLSPQEATQIRNAIAEEEKEIVAATLKSGGSPAQRILALAKGRGFRPQQAQNAPQPADTGAAPAADAAKGGVPAVKDKGGLDRPSVTDEISRIKQGQEAARSLSNGGGAPNAPLTAEKLVAMSEEEFSALYESMSPAEQRAILGG
jgi:hypothetical protein